MIRKYEREITIAIILIIVALITLILVVINYVEIIKINNYVSAVLSINNEKIEITTSEQEYRDMIISCMKKIYKEYVQSNSIDNSIDIDLETYIESEDNNSSEDNRVFSIASTVYSDDLVMVTFMNSSGGIKSTTATIDRENNNSIEVYDSELNYTLLRFNEYNNNETLSNIGDIIIKMIESNEKKFAEEDEFRSYFTDEEYENILQCINNEITIDNASISFMIFGRSDVDKTYYDRIIAQIKVDDSIRQDYTNIIIKLSDKGKIFDIDVI